MSDMKKRERSSNFEKSEVHLLTELVTKHKSVLENKKTDAVTNKEKEAVWSAIATVFNAASSGHAVRTSKALKLKYESLKKCTKKKMTLHRQELYRTGGGPSAAPNFNDAEEKVLAICSNISGLDARNDSDNFSDTANSLPTTNNNLPENGIPVCKEIKIYNLSIDGVTSQPADTLLLPVPEAVTQTQPLIEEVMEESDDYYENQNNKVTAESTDAGEVLKDCQNKWGTWTPKALKSKVSQALKPCKSSVTAKLDQLSTARMELVQLQKEIANREHLFVKEEHELKMKKIRNEEFRKQEIENMEHLFVKEEHELKMMNLRNEEFRKQELHVIMLQTMQRRNND